MTLSDVAIRLSYSPVHRRSATYWSIPMHPKRIHQLPRWKAMWKTISRLRIGPTVFQKWWTSTVGKIVTFPIWWESHKSHVPNHQPVCFVAMKNVRSMVTAMAPAICLSSATRTHHSRKKITTCRKWTQRWNIEKHTSFLEKNSDKWWNEPLMHVPTWKDQPISKWVR